MQLIEKMYTDVNFETFCQLNTDMIDLAAIVNELNLWSRYIPSVTAYAGQGHTESMERAHF
ncbi:MAG: hypothetical protein JWN30_2219, partial [Bacilli bacterium]|nr:hypothetical protein [Bacilli bacterium]